MEAENAIRALSALANDHRLAAFRILVRAGPTGLSATQLATEAGIGATTLSFHMKELERAGLVLSWRDGRFIRSAIKVDAMRELIQFLIDDCCQGRPELCSSDLFTARVACCDPLPAKTRRRSTP